MKASDLRVGNWVERKMKHTDQHCGYEQVRTIYEGKYGYLPSSYCVGIPLTEEWLLRFGFDKHSKDVFEHNCFIVSAQDDHFVLQDICIYVPIRTVHHLQNLYHSIVEKELILKS